MRRVVLDTETTGLILAEGHRIIEVAGIELDDRTATGNEFHQYLNPERDIESEAQKVHGLTSEFLASKPKFYEIADELYEFIKGSELIIHNASFDLEFLNAEFQLLEKSYAPIERVCRIIDTIDIARQMRPGRRNSLDALANEYGIDISARTTHGALLDAGILVSVYRALTGGQTSIELKAADAGEKYQSKRKSGEMIAVNVISATDAELQEHEKWLALLDEKSESGAVWRKVDAARTA